MSLSVLTFTCVLAFVSGARVEEREYPDCSLPKDAGTGKNASQMFYYNQDWDSCFAFKYLGEGGNTNRFDSRKECERFCKPMDGSVCSGPGQSYAEPVSYDEFHRSCETTVCPENYTCYYGMGGPVCCLTENNEAIQQGYAEKCPDGSSAGGVMAQYFIATFAHSCDDLICGRKAKCQQVNKYFAKCCSKKC